MSKILASQVFSYIDKDKNTVISFVCKENYAANLFVREVEKMDLIEVSAKLYKESRSLRQNKMLWGIIEAISMTINGARLSEDIEKIYIDLLKMANVKTVFLGAIPEAKKILEGQFRYVQELPNSMTTEKGVKMVLFKCFIGSSKFDTKEMSELIEVALKYASECGVESSEIESLKGLYD